MGRFTFHGATHHVDLVGQALAMGDYPFDAMSRHPGNIPIEWADLSRYVTTPSAEHQHWQGPSPFEHTHGEGYHGLEYRDRVLGLAWYSGKISLDLSLESDFGLMGEVLWSELAHMADFFELDDERRAKIFNLFHTGNPDVTPEEHGHGWFDVATYREEVGEALMGAFTRAFSSFPVTIPFAHTLLDEHLDELRELMLPKVVGGNGEAAFPFFGVRRSGVYHDRHEGVRRDVEWEERPDDRRPCRVCKP